MENFQMEEAVVKEYDSKLMRRLLTFTKPYLSSFGLVIIIMFVLTIADLYIPKLVKDVIDNNINGYTRDYSILKSYSPESWKIGDLYIKEGNIKNAVKASIVYSDNAYYLVEGRVNHKEPYKFVGDKLLQGKNIFKSYKIKPSEIKEVRRSDAKGVLNKTMLMLFLSILVFLLGYIQVYLISKTGQKIIFDIRQKLFRHVEDLSLSFFDSNPVGRLVTRITNDVETLNEMYTSVLLNLIKDAFLIIFILVAMFLLNVKLALITLFVIPVITAAIIIFKRYDREAYRDVRVKLARINAFLSENISGMKIVQIFAKEEKKYKEFANINREYFDASYHQLQIIAIFRPFIDLVYSLALAALLWFGGIRVINNNLTFGILFAFVSYLQKFFQPINDISEKYDILQSSMASSERIFMLLDKDERIKNPDNPVSIETLKGEIEFKNVWFAYKENDWVLKDVSFKINPGEKVAFVGATGAGKTSIISLISRFYDIQKGEILIDGINIKNMNKEDLRKNVATVLQDVFLFTGDIKGNIRLNNDEISDETIISAARYVNADKFIEKLPDKYDSYVNERGTTFSQGERQLIAFARAIAFNPPILVLDEATANIDTETESLIQDALEKITENRTTIIVAHRLSTIKKADKIIVLHKGKIRETGTHEELLKREGLYYNLYQLQYKDLA
ncbi:multidrug ABC transporter ATPase [Fervidicella metallireducens AeB]|uniref:Multidrug ABC transporter ATPase n=1 Tax=Fervidicella metallireducens AeB TaxID=1403537 RepID=A0A017RV76_9CLOT|nr:ABC transporter ATP-binding protein [Fervidicella metallireducens]EYE88329.1 multidrug ABC transporter ATPase [Fervidicella metallireducens AeB]